MGGLLPQSEVVWKVRRALKTKEVGQTASDHVTNEASSDAAERSNCAFAISQAECLAATDWHEI